MRKSRQGRRDERSYASRAPITWTWDHEREAWARSLDVARDLVLAGKVRLALELDGPGLFASLRSERKWRYAIGRAGLKPAEVDAAVRRVDGLATGRLVREERWQVVTRYGVYVGDPKLSREGAMLRAGDRVVRLRRIRRAR